MFTKWQQTRLFKLSILWWCSSHCVNYTPSDELSCRCHVHCQQSSLLFTCRSPMNASPQQVARSHNYHYTLNPAMQLETDRNCDHSTAAGTRLDTQRAFNVERSEVTITEWCKDVGGVRGLRVSSHYRYKPSSPLLSGFADTEWATTSI